MPKLGILRKMCYEEIQVAERLYKEGKLFDKDDRGGIKDQFTFIIDNIRFSEVSNYDIRYYNCLYLIMKLSTLSRSSRTLIDLGEIRETVEALKQPNGISTMFIRELTRLAPNPNGLTDADYYYLHSMSPVDLICLSYALEILIGSDLKFQLTPHEFCDLLKNGIPNSSAAKVNPVQIMSNFLRWNEALVTKPRFKDMSNEELNSFYLNKENALNFLKGQNGPKRLALFTAEVHYLLRNGKNWADLNFNDLNQVTGHLERAISSKKPSRSKRKLAPTSPAPKDPNQSSSSAHSDLYDLNSKIPKSPKYGDFEALVRDPILYDLHDNFDPFKKDGSEVPTLTEKKLKSIFENDDLLEEEVEKVESDILDFGDEGIDSNLYDFHLFNFPIGDVPPSSIFERTHVNSSSSSALGPTQQNTESSSNAFKRALEAMKNLNNVDNETPARTPK